MKNRNGRRLENGQRVASSNPRMLPDAWIGVFCDYSTTNPYDDDGKVTRPAPGKGGVKWVT